jgi:hypothetical protein
VELDHAGGVDSGHEKISMPPWGRLGWLLHLYFGRTSRFF